MLKLTDQGRKEVSNFVQKCEEFRKELLETGRDTGHIGPPDAGTVGTFMPYTDGGQQFADDRPFCTNQFRGFEGGAFHG